MSSSDKLPNTPAPTNGRWKSRIVGHDDVAPDQLLANPHNWRVHSHLQQRALESVLDEVGWVRRVLVNARTQHIVDGHLRVLAAMDHLEPTVPVDYIDVSEDEEQALLVTLDPIAALAGKDKDKLVELLGGLQTSASEALNRTISNLQIVPFLVKVGKSDPDNVPPSRATSIHRGELFQLGSHRLLCGDCTQGYDVASVGQDTVDLTLTDPPYSVGYENQIRTPGLLSVKQRGSSYVDPKDAGALLTGFVAYVPSDVLVMTYAWGRHLQAVAQAFVLWDLLYECVWVKNTFAYVMGRRYQSRHEPILIFRKKGGKGKSKGIWHVPSNQSTVFEYDKPGGSSDHPIVRPSGLWRDLMAYHSDPKSLVYDPFVGSGTTLITAEELNRRCVAIEISPQYCQVSIDRWETFTGLKAVKLGEVKG